MIMDDTDDSLTDPDQYMEPYDYFAVTSASIEHDFFEIEMTKALEEIFYNLRELRENRYEYEKRRFSSMDNEQELEDESCHEYDEETEDIENYIEKETDSERQDTEKVAPFEESRSELNRRLRMDAEKSQLEDVSFASLEVAEYLCVEPYSEEVRLETDAEQLKKSQSELNKKWSVELNKNNLGDKSLYHGEQTENITENIPGIETGSEQHDTAVDVVQVKENGLDLKRRLSMQLSEGDDSLQRVMEAKNEGTNPGGTEAVPGKENQAAIIQDKIRFPRRRRLPLLPTVKKSS